MPPPKVGVIFDFLDLKISLSVKGGVSTLCGVFYRKTFYLINVLKHICLLQNGMLIPKLTSVSLYDPSFKSDSILKCSESYNISKSQIQVKLDDAIICRSTDFSRHVFDADSKTEIGLVIQCLLPRLECFLMF